MPKVSEAHVEARRTQILEAACKCFSRRGFHQTTVRDICAEAELSPGAVYGYFKSKDEIVAGLAELGRRTTRSFLESIPTAEDAPTALTQLLGGVVDYVDSERAREGLRLDLRLWGEGLHTPHLRRLFLEGFANTCAPFKNLVVRGQTRGEIAEHVDADGAARVWVALCLGLAVQKAMDPDADVRGCSKVIAALLDGTFGTGRSRA